MRRRSWVARARLGRISAQHYSSSVVALVALRLIIFTGAAQATSCIARGDRQARAGASAHSKQASSILRTGRALTG
jgi:hypothetical protein